VQPELADTGLSTAAARHARPNTVDRSTSRTLAEIVRANVFNRFNAILGTLLAVILIVGPAQDALFGIVLVTNTAIGILQELRAKHALDRLAVLNEPRPRVVRDGRLAALAVERVVLGDVLDIGPGDQVVVDGRVLRADGLEVDESLLSGESRPVARDVGQRVLSGSFVVAGHGRFEATAVGGEAYAARLAAEARRFDLVRSDLRTGINQILRLVTWLLLPVAVLLVSSQLVSHHDLADALRASVAGIGSMIPEGLVLLTTIAFAVGAIRLARRRVLVQELAALEGLARVDVLCIDKTGTLTTGSLEVGEVVVLEPGAPVDDALGALAAADPAPNATLAALGARWPATAGWAAVETVPFSSARKWSGVAFADGRGAWVLGAPDVLLPDGPAREQAGALAASGARVVLLGRAPALDAVAPGRVTPVALVALHEQVRPEAPDALRYLADEGIRVIVLSGDHPDTAAAVAARAGLAVEGTPVDARGLADAALAASLVSGSNVFGRVVPEQKRVAVRALQQQGRVVGMTGDGVNDVLALKDADIGVAMGTGTPATRSVARVVLLDDSFATFPAIVAEGRRVIGNVERVGNLFVTKTVYAFALAVAVGVARLPFPFLPRHLTIVSSLTIGIPGFFLALAPTSVRARPGFVGRVLAFAVPAGLLAAAATFGAYAVARDAPGLSLTQARTAATATLFFMGAAVLLVLARPWSRWRLALVAAMAGGFAVVATVPPLRSFFALEPPGVLVTLATVGVIGLGWTALAAGWLLAGWVRHRGWPGGPGGPGGPVSPGEVAGPSSPLESSRSAADGGRSTPARAARPAPH
jgi:cation-transporting ATPase E